MYGARPGGVIPGGVLGLLCVIENKVILEGFPARSVPVSVVFLFFSNNRSWTTTFQDDDKHHPRVGPENLAGHQFRMTPNFITALLYCFLPSSRSVFIRDLLLLLLSFPSVVVGNLFFAIAVLLRNDRSPTKFLGDDDETMLFLSLPFRRLF